MAGFPQSERQHHQLPAGSVILGSQCVSEELMAFSRLGWRVIFPAVIVFGLLNLGAVKFVHEAYPADPFKSEALAKCVAGDPAFIRFSPDDRAKCYARQPRQTRLETPNGAEQTSN
jgi:hypothetical protein